VPAPAVPAPAVPAPVVVAPVVAPPPKATPKPPIAAPSPQRAFPAPRVAPGAASTQAGVGAGTGHVAANVAVPISEPPAAVPVTAPAAIPTAVPAPPAAMVMPIGEDTVDEVPEAPVSSLGFIDAMIAEEVGEYDGDVPVAQTNSAESPLLTFSMAGFSEADMALSKRFKEDFLRMKGENHFELLGIDRQVGSADVRKAYFKLVNDYHPDKLVGKPEAIQNLGAEIFNTIQDVYDTLTDSERRESYVAKVFYGREMEEEEAAVTTVETVFKADTFFKQGIGILNAGDLKGAHRAFEHAVEIYPQEPEYRACLGYTTFVLNYPKNKEIWQGAETLIQEALKENAKLDRGNYFMGQISLTKGKSTLARKYFVRALKANAKNVDAMKAYQRLKNAPKEEDKGVLSSLFSVFKK